MLEKLSNCAEIEQEWAVILPQLFRALLAKGQTVATAESCTAGMMAVELTKLAGSSQIFKGEVATYANSAKTTLLGVPESELNEHGAVSEAVAKSMAEGIRQRLGTDYSLSLTGVAGPEGGSAEKPVGMVYCGLATAAFTKVQCFKMYDLGLSGQELRHTIRRLSTLKALMWLWEEVSQ